MCWLEAMQTMESVVKQGNPSDVITWTAVAMAIVSNAGTWLMILKKGTMRKIQNPPQTNPQPGSSETCIKHAEKIAKTETKVEGIEGDIREIKDDIRVIRQAVVK